MAKADNRIYSDKMKLLHVALQFHFTDDARRLFDVANFNRYNRLTLNG